MTVDLSLGPSQVMLRDSVRAALAAGGRPPDTTNHRLVDACLVAAEVGRACCDPAPRPGDDPRSRLLAAADSWGACRAALEEAVAHTTQRVQFGRPLAAFQAVQHHVANMAMACDALELAVLDAASSTDLGLDAEAATLGAVLLAVESAPDVCTTAHQITGAAGLYLDHPLPRWTRRVLQTAQLLGGDPRPIAARLSPSG